MDAKSDHGDKKVGFFQNFRDKIVNFGRKKEAARSQGVLDHIDQVDLMDLAADLGCISVDEKSFTFKPDESSAGGNTQQMSSMSRIPASKRLLKIRSD